MSDEKQQKNPQFTEKNKYTCAQAILDKYLFYFVVDTIEHNHSSGENFQRLSLLDHPEPNQSFILHINRNSHTHSTLADIEYLKILFPTVICELITSYYDQIFIPVSLLDQYPELLPTPAKDDNGRRNNILASLCQIRSYLQDQSLAQDYKTWQQHKEKLTTTILRPAWDTRRNLLEHLDDLAGLSPAEIFRINCFLKEVCGYLELNLYIRPKESTLFPIGRSEQLDHTSSQPGLFTTTILKIPANKIAWHIATISFTALAKLTLENIKSLLNQTINIPVIKIDCDETDAFKLLIEKKHIHKVKQALNTNIFATAEHIKQLIIASSELILDAIRFTPTANITETFKMIAAIKLIDPVTHEHIDCSRLGKALAEINYVYRACQHPPDNKRLGFELALPRILLNVSLQWLKQLEAIPKEDHDLTLA